MHPHITRRDSIYRIIFSILYCIACRGRNRMIRAIILKRHILRCFRHKLLDADNNNTRSASATCTIQTTTATTRASPIKTCCGIFCRRSAIAADAATAQGLRFTSSCSSATTCGIKNFYTSNIRCRTLAACTANINATSSTAYASCSTAATACAVMLALAASKTNPTNLSSVSTFSLRSSATRAAIPASRPNSAAATAESLINYRPITINSNLRSLTINTASQRSSYVYTTFTDSNQIFSCRKHNATQLKHFACTTATCTTV